MKRTWAFSRSAAQVLALGALLAIFLASPFSQTQAADSSSQILVAAEKEPQEPKSAPTPGPCVGPPGSCYGINVSTPPADPSGCTSGSKCVVEGKQCNPLKKCKTVGAPGLCYCACM